MSGVECEAQRPEHIRKTSGKQVEKAQWKYKVFHEDSVTCVCYKFCKVTSV